MADGERVILDLIAIKLQIYDGQFHEHHYKLVDCIDDSVELEAQQRRFEDHDLRMLEFFTWITNLQSRSKTVMPTQKPAKETISLKPYNCSLQLIISRARIIDENVENN